MSITFSGEKKCCNCYKGIDWAVLTDRKADIDLGYPYWPISTYRPIWISNMGYPYGPIWAHRPIWISHIRYRYGSIWAYRPICISIEDMGIWPSALLRLSDPFVRSLNRLAIWRNIVIILPRFIILIIIYLIYIIIYISHSWGR